MSSEQTAASGETDTRSKVGKQIPERARAPEQRGGKLDKQHKDTRGSNKSRM
jgi:hypothetical protein